jgi:hypothetical protein
MVSYFKACHSFPMMIPGCEKLIIVLPFDPKFGKSGWALSTYIQGVGLKSFRNNSRNAGGFKLEKASFSQFPMEGRF